MERKKYWIDCRALTYDDVMMLIKNVTFINILINVDQFKKMHKNEKNKLIVDVNKSDELNELPKDVIVFSNKKNIVESAGKIGYETAFFSHIQNRNDMDKAWQKVDSEDYLIACLDDETNIPIELLIARLQKKDTKLFKVVKNIEEATVAFGVMEKGCDGVLIQAKHAEDILSLNRYIEKSEVDKVELVKVKVTDIQHIGMGHRVCVDTTTIMTKSEGMLIGSTSGGGLLISSETHDLPYMNLRPFRVNAGAVHSYVFASNNMTEYLSEVRAGSELMCVDTCGNTRKVIVGRAKTEIRPLLLIKAQYKDILINAIVQDDWHIRCFKANGEAINATHIKAGDELLAGLFQSGRHVGISVDEYLNEK